MFKYVVLAFALVASAAAAPGLLAGGIHGGLLPGGIHGGLLPAGIHGGLLPAGIHGGLLGGPLLGSPLGSPIALGHSLGPSISIASPAITRLAPAPIALSHSSLVSPLGLGLGVRSIGHAPLAPIGLGLGHPW